MKSFSAHKLSLSVVFSFLFFGIIGTTAHGQIIDTNKPETSIMWQTDTLPKILWSVKAYQNDAKLLAVKAIDAEGNIHNVKAIQSSDDTSVLSVKAFVNGDILPIKMIVNEKDPYLPVKAIANDGSLIDIKALNEKGEKLDVKGVSKTGSVIHIRAIDKEGNFLNVIAISPFGYMNNVKGVKMADDIVETTVNGVKVFAHVKAIIQDHKIN